MGETLYDRYFFKMNPLLPFTEVERKKGHKEEERVQTVVCMGVGSNRRRRRRTENSVQ